MRFRRARVAQLAASNTVHQMAETLGVSPEVIRRDLKATGTKAKRPRRRNGMTAKRKRVALRQAAVLKLWNTTGLTNTEIADRLGIEPTTVTTDIYLMRKRGLDVKPGKGRRPRVRREPRYTRDALKEVTETRRQIAKRMRDEGYLLREIAAELGVTIQTVQRYLETLRLRDSGPRERCPCCSSVLK